MTESFPRLSARTMNFQLGIPRNYTISPDGEHVIFARAESGTSREHSLWVYDVAQQSERLIADPAALLAHDAHEELTREERARRERMRVATAGVVAYSTDRDATKAVFALSSRLFVADLVGSGTASEIAATGPVIDPMIDPTGTHIAYSDGRALRVVNLAGAELLTVGPDPVDPPEVVWGLAEFIASEELDRYHGFWWAPDGNSLLVARYDESPVAIWHIANPIDPESEPVKLRYPQAGKANAVVSLHHVGLDGERVDVGWRSDRAIDDVVLEYLAEVVWSTGNPPLLALLTRDQRRLEIREVDIETGATAPVSTQTDECWVELLPGTPRRTADGRLLLGLDDGDTRRLTLDGVAFTPPGLQIRGVVDVEEEAVIASVIPKIASIALARIGFDGSVEILTDPDGVANGAAGGRTLVVNQRTLTSDGARVSVVRDGEPSGALATHNETSPLVMNFHTMQVGERGYPTTVLFPAGHELGSRKLPVLMDPYGGPHGQQVQNSVSAYRESQWFADQGFVVIVADGRGMAGRGPAWDRLARHDFIGTIDDQADVVNAVAEVYPDDLDLARVAIRGWSFGGYVALAGVLKRPDVFAAAVAGAPVSDQRWYDTCYSERYLGHPDPDKDVYDANDLTLLADQLERPLLMVHGLADDNVAFAHTLRMSQALLAAGKPHQVLPLSGITHMANSEVVAENLLVLQVAFLRDALKVDATASP